MRRGSQIIDSGVNSPEADQNFRSMGVIGPEKEYAGIVGINRANTPVKKTFRMTGEFSETGKVYVYIYNENELNIGQDGFVSYNQVIDASLKDQISFSVPGNTMVILSSKEL